MKRSWRKAIWCVLMRPARCGLNRFARTFDIIFGRLLIKQLGLKSFTVSGLSTEQEWCLPCFWRADQFPLARSPWTPRSFFTFELRPAKKKVWKNSFGSPLGPDALSLGKSIIALWISSSVKWKPVWIRSVSWSNKPAGLKGAGWATVPSTDLVWAQIIWASSLWMGLNRVAVMQ